MEPTPGQTISPQNSTPPDNPDDGAPAPTQPSEQPIPAPVPTPAPELESQTSITPEAPAAEETPPDTDWQFHQEAPGPSAAQPGPLPEDITWTAAEFVEHPKGVGWYALLALVGLAAAALDYFLTKDVFSTGVILFVAIVFGAYAARKPRAQQYTLNPAGVQVGTKAYYFHDFKTFSIVNEADSASIVFMPLKRFMPSLTIYVTQDIEDKVVDYLSAFLPFEQHKADAIDNLMRKIRF